MRSQIYVIFKQGNVSEIVVAVWMYMKGFIHGFISFGFICV